MLPTLHDLVQFVPLGLAVGAVYGVSGVGIVVLYRTTGVLNFAYGAIGALGVFIAFELLNNTATSWCPNWLAYLACVLVGGAVMLAYGLVFGPVFAARDPLVKAAATLGLTLILLAIMSWVWPANEVRAVHAAERRLAQLRVPGRRRPRQLDEDHRARSSPSA